MKKYLAEPQYTISSSLRKIPWIAGSNKEQEYLQEKKLFGSWKKWEGKKNGRDI